MSIRVGLIGAGVMGADHAKIIATQVPGATLRSICDADRARAIAIAEATGAENVVTDPLAVIGDAAIDAVLIASPDATHAPLTLACIAAGKPVLCEKPLSPSSRECLAILDAETNRGKRLVQVGFMRRFDPAYVEMKKTLKDGVLGAAVMMHNFHRNVSAPAWFTDAMAITNSAPHEFDIARFVLDADYESIMAYRPGPADAGAQVAPVFMVLKTSSGPLITIEVNVNAAYGYDVRGELVGEKGSVSLRAPVHAEVNVNLHSLTHYATDWRPRFAEAYRAQNAAWLHSITTGVPAGASAWDGYAATLTAECGVQSLQSGRPIVISMGARPEFYRA